eukprot:COSAG04_NODE_26842_length_290_cov_0.801047_1_plen_59_part_10
MTTSRNDNAALLGDQSVQKDATVGGPHLLTMEIPRYWEWSRARNILEIRARFAGQGGRA